MNVTEIRQAVLAGRRVYGTLIASPSPHWPAKLVGAAVGLDFVFLDTEHVPLGRETLSWMCRAYAAAGLAPIVRIPSPDPFAASQALDGGAAGIVAPYVETVEQAQALRGAVKFGPIKGARLQRLLAGQERLEGELAEYLARRNADKLLLVNIESVPAIENLDAILGVADLDGVLVGPHDLSCSLGIPEQYQHPRFTQALGSIIGRARAKGRVAGVHFINCGPVSLAIEWVRMGINLLIQQADIAYAVAGLRQDLAAIRQAFGDRPTGGEGSQPRRRTSSCEQVGISMPAADNMTAHERFTQTLTFGSPDRAFFFPGVPRRSTLAAWRASGMDEPGPGRDYKDLLAEAVGLPRQALAGFADCGVDTRMIPQFEERVLEHRDGHYVVQDWKGNVVEISDRFDVTYLRDAIDFVTRRWIRCPVRTRQAWEAMKRRYDPTDPARYPADFAERCRRLRGEHCVVRLNFRGPFDQIREWVGFERLCELFIEDPHLVREMVEFWTGFVSRALARLLEARVLDVIYVNEDVAYKHKSMISPGMTREFIKPAYDRWLGEFRQAAVPVVNMDSDGFVGELIPIWIESGFNCCYPIEVAAGNDINEYRRVYGRRMAYIGGIDKRAIAAGGRAIEAELARVAPVIRSGGFVPGCDHGVPPDISWPNFVGYCRMLAEMTGNLAQTAVPGEWIDDGRAAHDARRRGLCSR